MIHGRPDYEPIAYDDDWEDVPRAGFVPMWIGGMIIPLALIGYAITCFVTRHGILPGRDYSMDVNGKPAIAVGFANLGLGLFLHCHYFWGNIYQQLWLAVLGKIISLMGIIGSLGYLIIHIGVLGH